MHQAVASEDEKVGLKHPGLMLKYSTYKNLASLAVLRDDIDTAMDFYVQVKHMHCGQAEICRMMIRTSLTWRFEDLTCMFKQTNKSCVI